MICADFKCSDCGNVYEVEKSSMMDDFVSDYCPNCQSKNVFRVFQATTVAVAEGSCGNAETGYSSNVTYHPNSITGKQKGTKVD